MHALYQLHVSLPLLHMYEGTVVFIGPRYVVQIGDKAIDYNEDFRLFLTTRNPLPDITPDAASIISEVNFTTTKAGLTAQVCKEYAPIQ